MSNHFQDSRTTIIIATISVIGTVIATLGNAVISNWQHIFPTNNIPYSNKKSATEILDNNPIQETNIAENNQEQEESFLHEKKSSKQFERLETFVSEKQWIKAELELDLLQPQYLTCSQLSQINQIYFDGSNGKFGYKVQRNLWESKEINKDYKKLAESLGWKKQNSYIYNINDPEMITNFTAETKAKLGHLPFHGWQVKGIIRQDFGKFMDQLKQCNI